MCGLERVGGGNRNAEVPEHEIAGSHRIEQPRGQPSLLDSPGVVADAETPGGSRGRRPVQREVRDESGCGRSSGGGPIEAVDVGAGPLPYRVEELDALPVRSDDAEAADRRATPLHPALEVEGRIVYNN